MSEYSYNPERHYYADQHRQTPGGFTPLKEYEAISRGSYTPLASTTEPVGATLAGYKIASTANLTHKNYFKERAQSGQRTPRDEMLDKRVRPISNFDMAEHRSGKRRITGKYTQDSNILNLESLSGMRRGNSQPSHSFKTPPPAPHSGRAVERSTQRGGGLESGYARKQGRSASVFNFNEKKERSVSKGVIVKPTRRHYHNAPHFKSTIFQHELDKEPQNTGRFLTSYQLAARSLSPLAEGKNPRLYQELELKESASREIRKKPPLTKRNNQNWKNWSTINLSQQDGVSTMYQKMHSRLRSAQTIPTAQTLPTAESPPQSRKGGRVSHFRPKNEAQAQAYKKFLSKSVILTPKRQESPGEWRVRDFESNMRQLSQTGARFKEQRFGLPEQRSVDETRGYQLKSDPFESARSGRSRSHILRDSPGSPQNHQHLYLQKAEPETESRNGGRFRESPEERPRSEYIGRQDSIADDGAYSDIAISEYKVSQKRGHGGVGPAKPKPDWLVQQEREHDERSIQDTVNASVNFNQSEKKSAEYKFFQKLLLEEESLRKKLDKLKQSNEKLKGREKLEQYEVPSEAGSYVKRLDLDDNNFMDRMSGDPHRQQYLENEKKREKLRVLAGRPMIAGQSEELRKKAQLSGVPSMLSPGARASGYFGGSRMSLPCTSLDIGEVTSEMVLSKKQEHHQRLLQQIQYERAQKMNQKIKKLEDDKRERNTIEERNSLYSRKLQEIDSGKKEEMKAFINKQRREKVQQEIERVMTKTRLGIAAKQQARKMEENEKEALNTKKALRMKIADIQRAQMLLKSQHKDMRKSVERLVTSPAKKFKY